MVDTLDELIKNRKDLIKSLEINKSKDGLLALMSEIYPDKTHFVYELLQNAEDAKATSVQFNLLPDRLEFIHNGTKLFDLDDIDSITNIGYSTKKDTGNTIGKFGIGFKAVYAYTEMPKIYSGKWCFGIENRIIPYKLATRENLDSDITFFEFPFNKPIDAFKDISNRLSTLPLEALLFLNNIHKIEWNINNQKYIVYKKEQNNIVSLYKNNSVEPEVQYLKFSRNILINVEKKEKICAISLAYKLEKNKYDELEIVSRAPSEHNVFIFFPAAKEFSNLRYLINAPFATGPDRSSLKDDTDNKYLINEIVKLQLESMSFLKENGYLTTEFLGILPNSKDLLLMSDLYKPFHTALIDLFKNEDFTPTYTGSYRAANYLCEGRAMYRLGPHISKFISENNLKTLFEKNYTWVKNASLRNSPTDYFLQDLEIKKLTPTELIEELNNIGSSYISLQSATFQRKEIWENIIFQKNDTELADMYNLLSDYIKNTDRSTIRNLKNIKLFRCLDGRMYTINDGIYLWPENQPMNDSIIQNYHIIDENTLGDDTQKDEIKSFFETTLKIEDFSHKSICIEMLKKYEYINQTPEKITLDEHKKDIKLLLSVYEEYNYSNWYNTPSEIIKELTAKHFILTTDNKYVLPEQTFLDERYGNTHNLMKEVCDVLELSEINSVYSEFLDETELTLFCNILKEKNARKQLWIETADCKNNPNSALSRVCFNSNFTDTGLNKDYDLYKLSEIMRKELTPAISKLIWLSIIAINSNQTTSAIYKANQRQDLVRYPSAYIYRLKERDWIIDNEGNLKSAAEVGFDDLPADWLDVDDNIRLDYTHPVLKAIHFGKETQEKQQELADKNEKAIDLGFNDLKEVEKAHEIYNFLKNNNINFERIKIEFTQKYGDKNNPSIDEQIPNELPDSTVKNQTRRGQKLTGAYEEAPEVTRETKEYTVRTTNNESKKEAKQYLKDLYTDENEEMCCQLCQHELPFKKRNGEYYFETIQIFDNFFKREDSHTYLEMCPNCAAKYTEWVKHDEQARNKLSQKIQNTSYQDGMKSIKIEIDINGEYHTLYFTGKHYFDLNTIINLEKNEPIVETINNTENITQNDNQIETTMPFSQTILEENSASTNTYIYKNCNETPEIGDYVQSDSFGKGIVTDIRKNQSGIFLTVKFIGHGYKEMRSDFLNKTESLF